MSKLRHDLSAKGKKEIWKLRKIQEDEMKIRIMYCMLFKLINGCVPTTREEFLEVQNKVLSDVLRSLNVNPEVILTIVEDTTRKNAFRNFLAYEKLFSAPYYFQRLNNTIQAKLQSIDKMLEDEIFIDAFMDQFKGYSVQQFSAFKEKIQLLHDVIVFAKNHNFTDHQMYKKIINGDFVTAKELESFMKIMNRILGEQKRRHLKKSKRSREKLIRILKTLKLTEHPLAQKLIQSKPISHEDLDELERLALEENEKRLEERKRKQLEKNEIERNKIVEKVLHLAPLVGAHDHPIVKALSEGDAVEEDELRDFEKELESKKALKEEKANAMKALPDLMSEAERLFQILPVTERRTYGKYMNLYKKAFEKNEKPRKLKRNLEWIIGKMSVGK